MTEKLILWVPKLSANTDTRVLSGVLLPFGEDGRTNLGRLSASADSTLDFAEVVSLNVEHDVRRPIGRALALERGQDGLRASFRVLDTREGSDALLEAAEGLRCGLSVEIEPIVVRAGKIISGTVVAAGLVAQPAFPSARLAAAELAPVPDMPATGTDVPDVVIDGDKLADVKTVEVTPEIITVTTEQQPTEPNNDPAALAASEATEGNTMPNAALVTPALVASKPEPIDKNRLFAAFAEAGRTRLNAALSDIVPANIIGQSDTQPQYIGELWNGKAYERKYIPLFSHGDLTSFKISGWKWVTKPEVGLYAGNKTQIPSNPVETEPAEVEAQRIAGGHDIDRKYRDFSNEEFWSSYFAAMTESYARVSDNYALTAVATAATDVTAGSVPSGVAPGLVKIVDGALAILDATDTVPNFALVATDLWRAMLFTRSDDALSYLNAALGLEDGTLGQFVIRPSSALTAGQVLVGCKDAATVHELPGSPIRVEAVDVAKGGIDEALFGYIGVNIHDAEGLALVA